LAEIKPKSIVGGLRRIFVRGLGNRRFAVDEIDIIGDLFGACEKAAPLIPICETGPIGFVPQ
jgi:hypothetical protein